MQTQRNLDSKLIMQQSNGFSILELIAVMSLIAIMSCIAAFNYRALSNPQDAAAMELMSFIKQTRSKAIASTQSYTIRPSSSTTVITTVSSSCSGAQTQDSLLTLTLPNGASLTSTTWSICFEPRGISHNAVDIGVAQERGSKTVQVVLGGAVRVL